MCRLPFDPLKKVRPNDHSDTVPDNKNKFILSNVAKYIMSQESVMESFSETGVGDILREWIWSEYKMDRSQMVLNTEIKLKFLDYLDLVMSPMKLIADKCFETSNEEMIELLRPYAQQWMNMKSESDAMCSISDMNCQDGEHECERFKKWMKEEHLELFTFTLQWDSLFESEWGDSFMGGLLCLDM